MQPRHNKALQRRPRSQSLINIGVPLAAPLNAGVRRPHSKSNQRTTDERAVALMAYDHLNDTSAKAIRRFVKR